MAANSTRLGKEKRGGTKKVGRRGKGGKRGAVGAASSARLWPWAGNCSVPQGWLTDALTTSAARTLSGASCFQVRKDRFASGGDLTKSQTCFRSSLRPAAMCVSRSPTCFVRLAGCVSSTASPRKDVVGMHVLLYVLRFVMEAFLFIYIGLSCCWVQKKSILHKM